MPWVPTPENDSEADELVGRIVEAGAAVTRRRASRFGYHNHAFEFGEVDLWSRIVGVRPGPRARRRLAAGRGPRPGRRARAARRPAAARARQGRAAGRRRLARRRRRRRRARLPGDRPGRARRAARATSWSSSTRRPTTPSRTPAARSRRSRRRSRDRPGRRSGRLRQDQRHLPGQRAAAGRRALRRVHGRRPGARRADGARPRPACTPGRGAGGRSGRPGRAVPDAAGLPRRGDAAGDRRGQARLHREAAGDERRRRPLGARPAAAAGVLVGSAPDTFLGAGHPDGQAGDRRRRDRRRPPSPRSACWPARPRSGIPPPRSCTPSSPAR